MSKNMQSISRMLVILSCGFTLLACTVVTDPSSSSRSTSGGESTPSTALNKTQQISAFVAANFYRLKEDMAAGQGEYLTSLATLLDVEREQQADFLHSPKNTLRFYSVPRTPQLIRCWPAYIGS
ncbi:MAG: DUF3015 family protein [Candidatus Competibacteraceae bacterium]|nr:DUF3015 family protein [Candidatus Competibacteraceae bacterium]